MKSKTTNSRFVRKADLEIKKNLSIGQSNRSIESIQAQLKAERLNLSLALQQYQSRGSWSNALEKLMKELVEAEQQRLDGLKQITHHLQRLEQIDDQVCIFAPGQLDGRITIQNQRFNVQRTIYQ